jgi:hypothetical protein
LNRIPSVLISAIVVTDSGDGRACNTKELSIAEIRFNTGSAIRIGRCDNFAAVGVCAIGIRCPIGADKKLLFVATAFRD